MLYNCMEPLGVSPKKSTYPDRMYLDTAKNFNRSIVWPKVQTVHMSHLVAIRTWLPSLRQSYVSLEREGKAQKPPHRNAEMPQSALSKSSNLSPKPSQLGSMQLLEDRKCCDRVGSRNQSPKCQSLQVNSALWLGPGRLMSV